VLQRVVDGETLTVTMDGQPIAELRPVPGRPIPAATLLTRWRHLLPVDAQQLRADLDPVLDASLYVIGRLMLALCAFFYNIHAHRRRYAETPSRGTHRRVSGSAETHQSEP
jgi:antitoxin (DNA-binding transcriptional repressor) of toxin-antitoxin stability system